METRYKVITEGKLRDGVNPEQFVQAFSQAFKVPQAQARNLLTARRSVILKEDVDRDTAEKIRQVLTGQMGLEVRIEAKEVPDLMSGSSLSLEGESESPAEPETPTTPAAAGTTGRCPKCGSDRISGDDCLACGVIISRYLARKAQMTEETSSIYAAPTTNVLPEQEEYDDAEFGLRNVDAGAGWRWIAGGWRLFTRNPFAWIGALLVWYFIMIIANFIPFIGPIAVNILTPVFTAGFMLGASEQRANGNFTVGHLFAGFSTEFGKLVQVGLLTLAGGTLLVLVVVLFGFGAIINHANDGGPSPVSILLLVFVATILMALMAMAFLFVPMLVVFDGQGPIEGIKLSFAACWKNAMPFLVYGAVIVGMAVVAIIPIGLGFIVLAPVITASLYVSYRSIFHGDD